MRDGQAPVPVAAAGHPVHLDLLARPHQRCDEHVLLEVLVIAAEFDARCALAFATHCVLLDIDDALAEAAENAITS